jgi:ABC-type branched-subunit amino acid transport system ATPase component
MILQCESVTKSFGALQAIRELSFSVNEGEIFGIAGPNGAGKSVLFNLITHIPYGPTSGRIMFEGRPIQNKRPHDICRKGIARSFQVPVFFSSMTILENVMIGAYFGKGKMFGVDQAEASKNALEALEFLGLADKKNIATASMRVFDQKLLMIACCLATRPRLILLDEPMGGLNPAEVGQTMEIVRKIKTNGMTVVIIEHIMKALMGLSQRIMILDHGEKIAEGGPEDIANDEKVLKAYLGEKIPHGDFK